MYHCDYTTAESVYVTRFCNIHASHISTVGVQTHVTHVFFYKGNIARMRLGIQFPTSLH
jgi:hypothetical protein